MLTDRELQTLRNMGNEAEEAADEIVRLRAALAATSAPAPQWVPVSERMPDADRKVLATYTNELGNRRTIVARWTPAKTVEASGDDDEPGCHEYDEATDTFYLIEGWWEVINNWGDYSQVFVNEGKVDHWMPLPAAPVPQWTPEAAARTLALAEELRDKIKAKPDDEAGQGKEASK